MHCCGSVARAIPARAEVYDCHCCVGSLCAPEPDHLQVLVLGYVRAASSQIASAQQLCYHGHSQGHRNICGAVGQCTLLPLLLILTLSLSHRYTDQSLLKSRVLTRHQAREPCKAALTQSYRECHGLPTNFTTHTENLRHLSHV